MLRLGYKLSSGSSARPTWSAKRRTRSVRIREASDEQRETHGPPGAAPERRRAFFNWEPRGKWRIHRKPTVWQVRACRPWLLSGLAAVQPRIVVCLGATAAQALLGRGVRLTQPRGRPIPLALAPQVFATLHPSAVLRASDDNTRQAPMAHPVEDLSTAARRLAEPPREVAHA